MITRFKFHVGKGDMVEVISGGHRGAKGKVLQLIAKNQQGVVEGVRMIKKHLRKSQDNPQGSIAQLEGPIHVSNVKLLERAEKAGK
jgi:large subunit ribosomal protein L24